MPYRDSEYHIETDTQQEFVGEYLKRKALIQRKIVLLPKIVKTTKANSIMFTERIKQLREEYQMPQRQLAAVLEIDTATYCKIEKGERRARREQVVKLAELLQTDRDELLNLWLADQVYSVLKDEEHANKVLNIVAKNILEYGKLS